MNDNVTNIADRIGQQLIKAILLLVLLIICTFAAKAQQDPQFSQNKFNQLTVNPGFAGATGLINFSLLNRYQWIGFPGAPITTVFNADASLRLIGNKDGIGISIISDVLGFEKNVSVGINYSWRIQIGKGLLGAGVSLGLMNKNLNLEMSDMNRWGDLGDFNLSDPGLPKSETGGVLADLGVGLFYQCKNLELALSAKHLNQPTLSFDESGRYSFRRHYYLSGSNAFQMTNERFEAIPSFFFKTDATTWQADINIILQYDKRIWGGIGYRIGDAIIIMAGTELWNGIKFGYSYDISTSALSKYNAGSHEFFLAYSVFLNKKRTHKYKSVRFL
jgi:type IX secretion system PorP/SprF family membrane protein